MKSPLKQSVIITGASASGKTTLHCCLSVHFGLVPVPTHSTRKLRIGEVSGIDVVSMSEDEYMTRFNEGEYLEESPESAYFSGAFYGSPREWISATHRGEYNCFVCPTVRIARKVKEELGESIAWIHMTASPVVRKERLVRRDPSIQEEDFHTRLKRGGAVVDISGHDLCIDTSCLTAYEIFSRAMTFLDSQGTISKTHICVA